MTPVFVLVHSPLVGPATWGPLAGMLRERGYEVAIPDLRSTIIGGPPYGPHQVETIRSNVRDHPAILVGHSGAGPILPEVGDGIEHVGGYIFLDAGLPTPGESWFQSTPTELSARLRDMARDGVLPPWPQWWSPQQLQNLIPDPELRERFCAECPQLPVALFEEVRPPAPGWSDQPSGYLRCSDAYEQQADRARILGWPTRELHTQHLAVLTEPGEVIVPLLDLAARIQR